MTKTRGRRLGFDSRLRVGGMGCERKSGSGDKLGKGAGERGLRQLEEGAEV